MLKRILLYMMIISVLSACGWRPLYAPSAGTVPALDDIWIDTITGENGQALRNQLMDQFYRRGYPQNPRYSLTVRLYETTRSSVIRQDDVTTRAQLVQRATYSLVDRTTNETLVDEVVRTENSYNILGSQFTTLVTREDAADRGVRSLADKIQTRLAIYFNGLNSP